MAVYNHIRFCAWTHMNTFVLAGICIIACWSEAETKQDALWIEQKYICIKLKEMEFYHILYILMHFKVGVVLQWD